MKWKISPHDRCGETLSYGEISPREKCGENLSLGEISPHEKFGDKSVRWKISPHEIGGENLSQFLMFCRNFCFFAAKSLFYAIYAVLSQNLFFCDLRVFGVKFLS